MGSLFKNGIVLAAIGFAIMYFAVLGPVQRMVQGAPEVRFSVMMAAIGPVFAISGLGLVLATAVSRFRDADFEQNLFQKSPLHRSIVILGMFAGLALGIYLAMFWLPHKQAEYGYLPG